jgi:predicted DNA-binding transcriptional regulator YafY
MPPLVFSPEEAVALYLGTGLVGELWGQPYRAAAQGALAKLDNVLPDEQRQEAAWAQRSLVATGLHRASPDRLAPLLEKLRRAVRELRRVRMHYRSSGRPVPQERDLDPYALVYRWGWWYVVGYCHLRQGLRSFRLDRILELTLLAQVFTVPEDFDLHTYLESELQAQPQFQASLRFLPQAAPLALDNRAYWDALEEQPDGSVIVHFSAPDLDWAASTTLAYGPVVEALAPPELRQRLQEWVAAIVRLYPADN